MPTVDCADAFYLPLGEGRFRSTEHTGGPWDPRHQHAGPPSALLTRAIERHDGAWPGHVVRLSIDILGPIPVAELSIEVAVLRSGRSVELVQADLHAGERIAARATGWRVRDTRLALPEHPQVAHPVPPFPPEQSPIPQNWVGGYLQAMEWRQAAGHWNEPGPATVWGRMRHPLVSGEEPSGLQRVLTLADSGNGASAVLPGDAWFFINPELTVHLAGEPRGEWICLDAETTLDGRGFGLATSRLFDRDRLVARAAQSLYVGSRA